MKMIFKQSNLIIALSIGLQLQSGNASAFDLSDVTNAVDQVNSVAKQLNAPQSEPTAPTPIPPPQAFPVTTVKTEASNPSSYVFHHAPPEDISDWAEATSYEETRIGAECLAYHVLMNSKYQDCSARPSFPNTLGKKVIVKEVAEHYCTGILPGTFQEGMDQEAMHKHCVAWRIKENDPVIMVGSEQTKHETEIVESVDSEVKKLTKQFGPISKKTGGLKGFCKRWADAKLAPMSHKETYDACIAEKGISLEY
jgi:hypothetical protein